MNFLHSLAENRIHLSLDDLYDLALKNQIKPDASRYLVFLVACYETCDDLQKYQRFSELESLTQKYVQRNNRSMQCDSDGISTCMILRWADCEIDENLCSESLKSFFLRHGMKNATIVSGGIVSRFENIHDSYERALNTLHFVGAGEEGKICYAKDYEHLFELPVLQSIIGPEHILRLFSTGTLDELRNAVTLSAEQVRSMSGYADEPHHPTSIRRSFIEWTVYVLHVSSDMGVDVEKVLAGVDPYRHLMTMKGGTPAIIEWFVGFCGQLREAIRDRQESKEDQLIHKAKALIDSNITNYNLSLSLLSQELGVSTAYLSRLLTKKLNNGFSQYLNQRRLELACDQLIATDLTIDQIAIATGFSSGAYLGRRFKQEIGCTPNQYRKQRKKRIPEQKSAHSEQKSPIVTI